MKSSIFITQNPTQSQKRDIARLFARQGSLHASTSRRILRELQPKGI